MSKTIQQTVVFKNTAAKDLYNLYMDSKKHSIATASPAKLSTKEGGSYSAFGNYITGKNLHLVKDKIIVQTWRASEWDKTDPDSVFIIFLEPKGKDTVLHATHVNVPDKSCEGITKGWHKHYWKPWKKYLAGKPISESIKM